MNWKMEKILLNLIQKSKRLFLNPFTQLQRSFEPSIVGVLPQCDSDALEDKKSEGFVWGVPKKRRTIEVRWSRNMGAREWVWKMLEPKTNLRTCETCGHHYEAKHLCRNCYEKIKKESEVIRERVEAQIANQAEDKSVVVLYGNEKENIDTNSYAGQMLVEIPKERPPWFSKNLMQKSTTGPDPNSTTIVPKAKLG